MLSLGFNSKDFAPKQNYVVPVSGVSSLASRGGFTSNFTIAYNSTSREAFVAFHANPMGAGELLPARPFCNPFAFILAYPRRWAPTQPDPARDEKAFSHSFPPLCYFLGLPG